MRAAPDDPSGLTPHERLRELTAIMANGIHRLRAITPAPPECRQIPAESSPTGLDPGAKFYPYTIVESDATQPVGLRTPFEALSNEAQGRLRELMESLDPLGKLAARVRVSGRRPETGGRIVPVKNDGRTARRDIRLPKPGDVLRRCYKGRAITIRVLGSGFEYEGRRFRSLSAIAKAVTGAHWNGLLFFGIVHQER
jgi:hypothetical protein